MGGSCQLLGVGCGLIAPTPTAPARAGALLPLRGLPCVRPAEVRGHSADPTCFPRTSTLTAQGGHLQVFVVKGKKGWGGGRDREGLPLRLVQVAEEPGGQQIQQAPPAPDHCRQRAEQPGCSDGSH